MCSDKTGTLTQGRMVTRMSWIPSDGTYRIDDTDDAFDPTVGRVTYSPMSAQDVIAAIKAEKGDLQPFQLGEAPVSKLVSEEIPEPGAWVRRESGLSQFLDCAALCNLASVFEERNEQGTDIELTGKWAATGDPTEIGAFGIYHIQWFSLTSECSYPSPRSPLREGQTVSHHRSK